MNFFKKPKGTEITPSSPGSSRMMRDYGTGFIDDFESIFEDFRRSFDNLMKPYFPFEYLPREIQDFSPVHYAPLDLIDEGDQYKIQVELPGMTKDDVEVNVTNEHLTIKAQKETSNENSGINYLHRERHYATWKRELRFPEDVYPDKAQGSMKEGLLELTIPKKELKAKEKVHTVQII